MLVGVRVETLKEESRDSEDGASDASECASHREIIVSIMQSLNPDVKAVLSQAIANWFS
jgi:hypothetical protein